MSRPKDGHKWMPFNKARMFVHALGFKSSLEWSSYCKSGAKPSSIPAAPREVYSEWCGFGDWLGTGNTQCGNFLTFKQAREVIRQLRIPNYTQWRVYSKSGKRPDNIPASPAKVYKDWAGWGDWLGNGRSRNFLQFTKARAFARSLHLSGWKQWAAFCKSSYMPENIPASPNRYYADGGWVSVGDWLGTNNVATYSRVYRGFIDARDFVRKLGLTSQADWVTYCASGSKPHDIPNHANEVYAKEWVCMADWLGNWETTTFNKASLLAYVNSIAPEFSSLRDADLALLLHGALPALHKVFETHSLTKVIAALRTGQLENKLNSVSDSDLRDVKPAVDIVDDTTNVDDVDVTESSLHMADRLSVHASSAAIEHLIESQLFGLRQKYTNANGNKADVLNMVSRKGKQFYTEIKRRFINEVNGIESLKAPQWKLRKGGKVTQPNTMQKFTAWKLTQQRTWCNWSGTGAGKTASAGLAASAVKSKLTVVFAPNSTLPGWKEQLEGTLRGAHVYFSPQDVKRGFGAFLVINYEKIQTTNDGLVRQVAELKPDMFVLDEVQLVKQRGNKVTIRRQTLEDLLLQFPRAKVLGMTATPVINELSEGISLLTVVSGDDFGLSKKPTIDNALRVHFSLLRNGMRYRPQYEQVESVITQQTNRDDLLKTLRKGTSDILTIERKLLPAKLELVRSRIKPGTVVYLEYLNGLVEPTKEFITSLGYSVGEYTGDTSTTEREQTKHEFIAGHIDVLIGSRAIALGVDGLQERCNNLILLSLPWTHAAFEQIKGRVYRQGSKFSKVEVIVPQVVINNGGERWSWDESRWAVIESKRTLADCATDGVIPTTIGINRNEFTSKALAALDKLSNSLQTA